MDWRLSCVFIGVVAVVNGLPSFQDLYESNTNLDRELVLKLLQERKFRVTAEPDIDDNDIDDSDDGDSDDDDIGGPNDEKRRKIIMTLFTKICKLYVDDDKRQIDDDSDNDEVFDRIRTICKGLEDDSDKGSIVKPPLRRPGRPPKGNPESGPRATGGPGPRPTGRPGPRPTGRPGPRPIDRPGPRPTGRPGPQPTGRPGPRPTGLPTINEEDMKRLFRHIQRICDMRHNTLEQSSKDVLGMLCGVLDDPFFATEQSLPTNKPISTKEPFPTGGLLSTSEPFPTGGPIPTGEQFPRGGPIPNDVPFPTGGPRPTGEPEQINRLINMLQHLCGNGNSDNIGKTRKRYLLAALCKTMERFEDDLDDNDDNDDIADKSNSDEYERSLQMRKVKKRSKPTHQPGVLDLENVLNVIKMACEVINGGKNNSSNESGPDERQADQKQLLEAICNAIAGVEDDD